MPTVPLEALGVRNHARYVFEVGARTRVNGVQTRRLEFQEFESEHKPLPVLRMEQLERDRWHVGGAAHAEVMA
jgi:hypothetical protein